MVGNAPVPRLGHHGKLPGHVWIPTGNQHRRRGRHPGGGPEGCPHLIWHRISHLQADAAEVGGKVNGLPVVLDAPHDRARPLRLTTQSADGGLPGRPYLRMRGAVQPAQACAGGVVARSHDDLQVGPGGRIIVGQYPGDTGRPFRDLLRRDVLRALPHPYGPVSHSDHPSADGEHRRDDPLRRVGVVVHRADSPQVVGVRVIRADHHRKAEQLAAHHLEPGCEDLHAQQEHSAGDGERSGLGHLGRRSRSQPDTEFEDGRRRNASGRVQTCVGLPGLAGRCGGRLGQPAGALPAQVPVLRRQQGAEVLVRAVPQRRRPGQGRPAQVRCHAH